MRDTDSDSLIAAKESLLLGVKMSKQGAYGRRAPAPDSLPYFERARELLSGILTHEPENREALGLMSQISENLMHFTDAERYLTRAFAAGAPKSKKSLKRLALLRENAEFWQDLMLTPEQLRELGVHLTAEGVGPGHQTMEITRNWLIVNGIANPSGVIASLEHRGAFTDFQVLANLVH